MSRLSGRPLFLIAILLVAMTLRPTLASIGPLLDTIQRDTGLNDTDAGLLTTLPVALMGLCLLGTSQLKALFGERVGVTAGIALIAVACWGGGDGRVPPNSSRRPFWAGSASRLFSPSCLP